MAHLDRTTLIRNNWGNRVLKGSPTEYYYIYYIYNTDWLCAPFFLNYFESEWFFRDEPFIKNVSFGGAQKKYYIFKLVNNPIKEIPHKKKHVFYMPRVSNISIEKMWKLPFLGVKNWNLKLKKIHSSKQKTFE